MGDNSKMTLINAVLMTQGLPSLNPRKIIGSSKSFVFLGSLTEHCKKKIIYSDLAKMLLTNLDIRDLFNF
jgi:hypothetical protein